jgi:hypothetical protein
MIPDGLPAWRACEVVGLEWHQVEMDQGRLHVRRAKMGRHPFTRSEATKPRRYGISGDSSSERFGERLKRAHKIFGERFYLR